MEKNRFLRLSLLTSLLVVALLLFIGSPFSPLGGGTSSSGQQSIQDAKPGEHWCPNNVFFWSSTCKYKKVTLFKDDDSFDLKLTGNSLNSDGCYEGIIEIDGDQIELPDWLPWDTLPFDPNLGTFTACSDGLDITIDFDIPEQSISVLFYTVAEIPAATAQIKIQGNPFCQPPQGAITVTGTVTVEEGTIDLSAQGSAYGSGSSVFSGPINGTITGTPNGGGEPETEAFKGIGFKMSPKSCKNSCTYCGSPLTRWLVPETGGGDPGGGSPGGTPGGSVTPVSPGTPGGGLTPTPSPSPTPTPTATPVVEPTTVGSFEKLEEDPYAATGRNQ